MRERSSKVGERANGSPRVHIGHVTTTSAPTTSKHNLAALTARPAPQVVSVAAVPTVEGASTLQAAKRATRTNDIFEIERAIDLRRLRYFVQIVMEGSFSNAAQRVRVAQPALSHHVRELEAILGVSLLTRSAHGVAATEAGQCLYDHAVTILGRIHEAAVDVSKFGAATQHRVVIGLEGSVAEVLAAPLIESVKSHAPHVQLSFEEGGREDLLKLLEAKRLDIALIYDAPEKRTVAAQPLLTEALYLVGAVDITRSDIDFEEAARLPLILPRRPSRLRERLEKQAQASGIALNVAVEIDGVSSMRRLAQAGLGYAVFSAAEFVEDRGVGMMGGRLIVRPSLDQTLSLCHLAGNELSSSAAKVRRLTLQVTENLLGQTLWPGLAWDSVRKPFLTHAACA